MRIPFRHMSLMRRYKAKARSGSGTHAPAHSKNEALRSSRTTRNHSANSMLWE